MSFTQDPRRWLESADLEEPLKTALVNMKAAHSGDEELLSRVAARLDSPPTMSAGITASAVLKYGAAALALIVGGGMLWNAVAGGPRARDNTAPSAVAATTAPAVEAAVLARSPVPAELASKSAPLAPASFSGRTAARASRCAAPPPPPTGE